ncbi:MAG: DUF1501 domain-containing protein [Planctomycetota bacterium]|nr:MAG: DUF1501 domain-containing protein [Planctomycetota bacterium]REK24148.1 MAG: DUF1501 domain-containing protein [Planctomycetota bacterium]REK38388.1 MAG: DUF1501 domain-containing protein [Planctomycetota bacterium]
MRGSAEDRSSGPLKSRREVLRAGLTGFSSLSLAGLLQARAQAAVRPKKTAVILVWLRGGASHLDTFDPKPLVSSDYRGPFAPIDTNVPGIQVTELLPRLSQIADRYAILRSMAHTGGGHPSGSLQMLGGDPDAGDKPKPVLPDWMSVVSYLRRDPHREIPNYIAVNPVDRYDSFTIAGPTYLGPAYEPFRVTGDPSAPNFEVPNIAFQDASLAGRLRSRLELKSGFDRLNNEIDQSGMMEALDGFESQAVNLLMSPTAREAFDLSREPDALRDRYGRHQWGQQCLMARRLIEAGVDVVTTEFDGPLCGRVANWDDHAVNHHVFDALSFRAPYFDQAVSALIEDVYDRGLDKRVLVVVTGEFGRTPKISYVASSGGGVASGPAGTVQPGRDHWPRAGSILFAGGGIQTGQVIGATDPRGEDPVSRRVGPHDFLATIYHHLGIDYANTAPENFAGRPVPIVTNGAPIAELT